MINLTAAAPTSFRRIGAVAVAVGVLVALLAGCARSEIGELVAGKYPLHTNITATTFWVGEIYDPNASDGSQVLSTYDSLWFDSYGGCDGVVIDGSCQTEKRSAANGYFPSSISPRENPFDLDRPYDDINDEVGFAGRDDVVPWAGEAPYLENSGDRGFSFLKNRWVVISRAGLTCYGQIQDAGPGQYHDSRYVFGSDDERPRNKRWDNAGLDVSPAINGCLQFEQLDGTQGVDWAFVDEEDVPDGPWKEIVTTSQVR